MTDTRSASEIMRGALGDKRADAECLRDGAGVTLAQIEALRRQLDRAEKMTRFAMKTGTIHKHDDRAWRGVDKAAGKLLQWFV